MPGGESRIDVCQRVHQFFGTIQRDAGRHGIDDIIVVSHGVTIRCFTMMWCNHTVEWLEAERNPANCSIRLLKGGEDCGLIYTGMTDTSAGQQEEREAVVSTEEGSRAKDSSRISVDSEFVRAATFSSSRA